MNWKGFGAKRTWPNFKELSPYTLGGTEENHKTSVRIAGLLAVILYRDLPNSEQEYALVALKFLG
jgi:hypothetical protein